MNLSEHFTLEEMTASEIAIRKNLDNTPPEQIIENLTELALSLERIRGILNHPIRITSGYRSVKVNAAIGGSPTSAHCMGYAADFVCPEFGTPQEIAKAIISVGIPFDQLIYEGTWVHFSIDERMRGQVLTAYFGGSKVTYINGIV